MVRIINRLAAAFAAILVLALPLAAQNRTYFGGTRNAFDYAYGINPAVPPLNVAAGGGTTATGVGTLTVNFGFVAAADGTTFFPLSTNAPIIVGVGTNADTVTPSAVSCLTPQIYATCQVTATFSHTHNTGEQVASGSVGLQEALNYQLWKLGGAVSVDYNWALYGGTSAIISAASYYSATVNELTSVPGSSVFIEDFRGQGGSATNGNLYWTLQPSTLTTISAPTYAATNISYSGTGTWSNTTYYFCVTYLDPLGGESACSTAYSQANGTASQAAVLVSPAASTGAVGWRAYAGTASSALYALPLSSTQCTLTALETIVPACAIGSNATIATLFVNNNFFFPVALGVTNTNSPVPQSHTTFAFQPSALPAVPFQTNYGPFGSGTITTATASDVNILGSFVLPAGYLNVIGRTIRISGKIELTAGASSTLGIFVYDAWSGGTGTGLGSTTCNPKSGFVFATAASVVDFSCTLTTNAVGATAIGSVSPESWFLANTAAGTGTTSPQGVENTATTIGSLGLFAQDQFSIGVTPLVANDTSVQLISLHIETLL